MVLEVLCNLGQLLKLVLSKRSESGFFNDKSFSSIDSITCDNPCKAHESLSGSERCEHSLWHNFKINLGHKGLI